MIEVRRIRPVSDMREIDELVESVKLDAIKRKEKKLKKPFTPDVKKNLHQRLLQEKKALKKETVQVEKASKKHLQA